MLRNRSLLAMALAMTLALPASVRAEGDATKGRQIAIDHCSRRHVIPDVNPYGGIGSTPSFRLLAKRGDYLERFQSFYARPPHPVFVQVPDVPPPTDNPASIATFEITPQQVEDIIAYAENVRAAE